MACFESLELRRVLAADVIISEFVARNDSGLVDEDGERQDWIELFNRGDQAADLDRWALTDDPTERDKWRLPARTLAPGKTLVVFASGKDRQDDVLHTNFRLSGDGEYLALVAPGDEIVDAFDPAFPRQVDDVSYGVEMQHLIASPERSGSSTVISARLVSHYDFEDAANLGDDLGAFNRDAQVMGNARQTSDAAAGAGALFLDGDGDFLEITRSGDAMTSLDDNGSGFTFAAWVNLDSDVAGNRRLFSRDMQGGPFSADGWGVGLRPDNTLLATTYGRVDFDEPSGAAIEDGDWRHVAYVFDPAAGTVTFFLDGVALGTETGTPAGLGDSPATSNYLIGALNLTSSGNGQFFRGAIDDVRIYDGPLSEQEVASLATVDDAQVSTVRYWIPTDASLDTQWTQPTFDDSGWPAAPAALGYAPVGSELSGQIRHAIPAGTGSVYLRSSFHVDDADAVESLLLRTRSDDGYVAYLNGVRVVTSNAPTVRGFDSLATSDRPLDEALTWNAVDLSSHLARLRDGENTLAIHALNDSLTSPEMFIAVDLIAVNGPGKRYLRQATPGQINSFGNDFGPLIERVEHQPSVPAEGETLTVTAQVSLLAAAVDMVTLHYRRMYDEEVALPMNDAGVDGDAIAGDGIFTAVIPGNVAAAGEMLRYAITTQDVEGRALREPYLPDANDSTGLPEYLGTVIANPEVSTALPVFQWFVPDPNWHQRRPGNPGAGNNREWTTASAFFDGEFYDNIQVRVRGSSTVQNWRKPKFKFEFNDVHEFRYDADQERVDEFNLQSHLVEVLPGAGLGSTAVSYMRETLAYQFLQEIGAPASTAFHMRVQQNGEFYALASFIEQVDRAFLRRNGFDDEGAMYKATPTVQSTLAPNPNPGIYRKVTQRQESFDDLRELTNGLNGRLPEITIEQYIFDHVNLPQVINLMAGQTILMNHDRLTKNYYMHRDPTTGEWSRFPWDVEQAFSNPQWTHFVSVLYGDSEHTQGTGNEPQYPNWLLDAILDTPRTRQMFLERVRTLMDQYLGDQPGGYFEQRIDELAALITPDAQLDNERWRAGDIRTGIDSIKQNLQIRREALANDPLVPGRDTVLRTVELIPDLAPARVLLPTDAADGTVDGVPWYQGGADFPDDPNSGWTSVVTGIGYERSRGYVDYINGDVVAVFDPDGDGTNLGNSLYVRIEFEVSDPAELDELTLRLRYDDGFVAYLNGHEVARAGAPEDLAWDSFATRAREARTPIDQFRLPLMQSDGTTPILIPGTNVLAFHALNRSLTDSDFLLQPTLVGGILEPRRSEIRFGVPDDDGTEAADEIVFNPVSGNQDEAYITIINEGNAAVDMSHWRLEGGVRTIFQPGTVLAPNSTLYLSPNVVAFRARSTGPAGRQGLLVQPIDDGRLSNLGETLTLRSAAGDVVAQVTVPAAPSDVQQYLRVSEIHYNPAGGADATEFIELFNTSLGENAVTLDLSGVRWTEGPSEPFVIPAAVSLEPGERLVIVSDRVAFQQTYPAVPASRILGPFAGRLSNDGERIKLDDAQGATIVDFEYSDGPRWPIAADGAGPSLEWVPDDSVSASPLQSRASLDKPMAWRASVSTGGTPGRDRIAPPGVVINEILADSPADLRDAIELHNTSGQAVDVSGWYLSDSDNNLFKFEIPAGTIIPALGFVVFDERDFNPTPENPLANHFALNSEGDQLWLIVPDSAQQGQAVAQWVDAIEFGASAGGGSLGRDDATGLTWVPQRRTTLGSENRGMEQGPLVISELMIRPGEPSAEALAIDASLATESLEYIELHNPTRQPLTLDGWRLTGGVEWTFGVGTVLMPDQTLLLVPFDPSDASNASQLAAFRQHYGLDVATRIEGGYQGQLANTSEMVRLMRPAGDTPDGATDLLVDQIQYDDRGAWPAAVAGQSLQRRSPVAVGDLAASWLGATARPGRVEYAAERGDLDGNGRIDAGDIDRMFDAIARQSNLDWFDLNQDRILDQRDADTLVDSILGTAPGDANLDGVFDSRDLVLVFQAGGYEDDVMGNATWAGGDWNGDGELTTADLVLAFQRGGYHS